MTPELRDLGAGLRLVAVPWRRGICHLAGGLDVPVSVEPHDPCRCIHFAPALARHPVMNATHRIGPSNGKAMVLHIPGSVPPGRFGGLMAQRTVSWSTMGKIPNRGFRGPRFCNRSDLPPRDFQVAH